VSVKGTGGVADEWGGKYFDERRTRLMIVGSSPEDAVKKALDEISRGGNARSAGPARRKGQAKG
jgi:hypothetical protein